MSESQVDVARSVTTHTPPYTHTHSVTTDSQSYA